MNEIDAKIHKIGTVTCALSGKEGDGLVVTFGEFKTAPLSWKSFRQLLGMRCPKTEAKGNTVSHGTSTGTSTGGANGTVSHATSHTTPGSSK